MSDALLKHNWHLLINACWSPLYPFLIGLATWIVHPSGYWEFPLVHVVNFAIFLGALVSFEFLLHQVICVYGQENGRRDADSALSLQVWKWQLLGYSIFAWGSFVLIDGLRRVNPDLCVAMFVYLDAGLLLKLRTGTKRSRTCLLLGLTLGFGYLAKAILFPMAFVFMAVAFFMVGKWRKAVPLLAMTLVLFSAIAAPLCIGISQMVGRPSFGESGSLNYAWNINGKPWLPFYSSVPPPYLKHPMDLLIRHPDIFGFGGPFASTYPLWDDPVYWNTGVSAAFTQRGQPRLIGRNLAVLFAGRDMVPIYILEGGLILINWDAPRRFKHIVRGWPLLVPGVVALCLFALVHLLPRYIGSFVVLAFLGLIAGITFQNSRDTEKRSAIVTMVIAASVLVFYCAFYCCPFDSNISNS